MIDVELLPSFFLLAGDDVVIFKHGEKSAEVLTSTGFKNLAFKTYSGYPIQSISLMLHFISKCSSQPTFSSSNQFKLTDFCAGLGTTQSPKKWMMSANGSLQNWSLMGLLLNCRITYMFCIIITASRGEWEIGKHITSVRNIYWFHYFGYMV